jgi:hypothetical protein
LEKEKEHRAVAFYFYLQSGIPFAYLFVIVISGIWSVLVRSRGKSFLAKAEEKISCWLNGGTGLWMSISCFWELHLPGTGPVRRCPQEPSVVRLPRAPVPKY